MSAILPAGALALGPRGTRDSSSRVAVPVGLISKVNYYLRTHYGKYTAVATGE